MVIALSLAAKNLCTSLSIKGTMHKTEKKWKESQENIVHNTKKREREKSKRRGER
jgi:hypothetical protein